MPTDAPNGCLNSYVVGVGVPKKAKVVKRPEPVVETVAKVEEAPAPTVPAAATAKPAS